MTRQSSDSVSRRITPPIRSSQEYFRLYEQVVSSLPHSVIQEVAEEILRGYEEGRTIFLFGNGGSAALASHFACDLGKGTLVDVNRRQRLRVLALTDNVPLMTAWANDSSYEDIFAEQLQNLALPGDIAFAISGSGNSPNVLHALEVARALDVRTVGLTGFRGGAMKVLCDLCIIVPSDNMQIIEDFHLSVAHSLFLIVRHAIRQRLTLAAGAHD
jgi:D-sedoheptulose 7-phosphate isomerase